LPKGTIQIRFSCLQNQGFFKGTIANFNTNMNIASSFGNAKIKATFDQSREKITKIRCPNGAQQFDLGNLSFDYLQWASSTLYQETGLVSRQLGLISAGLGAGLKATFLDLC
jgi:hypothetical protein